MAIKFTKQKGEVIRKDELIRQFENYLNTLKNGDYSLFAEIETSKRTVNQNASIHLYLTQIADALNEKGRTFNFEGIKGVKMELQYTQILLKETLWRPVQMALFDKKSTTELTTKEVSEIAKPIEMFFAKQGLNIPFPSIEHEFENEYKNRM